MPDTLISLNYNFLQCNLATPSRAAHDMVFPAWLLFGGYRRFPALCNSVRTLIPCLLTDKEKCFFLHQFSILTSLTWHVLYLRYVPQVLGDASIQHILTLIIVFLCSSNYIKNPYLTAKLVEVYTVFFVHWANPRFIITPWYKKYVFVYLVRYCLW